MGVVNPSEDFAPLDEADIGENINDIPMLTLVDFMVAHEEMPEAFIETFLNLDTNLLAFSTIFFSSQTTTLIELLMNLKRNDNDKQKLVVWAPKEARRIDYNGVGDSFKYASPNFTMPPEKGLYWVIEAKEDKLIMMGQSLPSIELKVKEVEKWMAGLWAELAKVEATVAEFWVKVASLGEEKDSLD